MEDIDLTEQILANGPYIFNDRRTFDDAQFWLIRKGKLILFCHLPEEAQGKYTDLVFKNVTDHPMGNWHEGQLEILAEPGHVFRIINVPRFGPMRDRYLDAILEYISSASKRKAQSEST